jgi:hypothetical protein
MEEDDTDGRYRDVSSVCKGRSFLFRRAPALTLLRRFIPYR